MSLFHQLGILSLAVVCSGREGRSRNQVRITLREGDTLVLKPWRRRLHEYVCIAFHKACVDKLPVLQVQVPDRHVDGEHRPTVLPWQLHPVALVKRTR